MQQLPLQAFQFLLRAPSKFLTFLELFSTACFRVLFHTRNTPGIPAFQSLESQPGWLPCISTEAVMPFMGLASFTKLTAFIVESLLV
jgi:hypothetical protein